MKPAAGSIALALLALTQAPLVAEDWPQFRGPNCSGISTSRGLPTTFSHKDKVRWQVELGDGLASPVIAAGRVFSTAMTKSGKFAVIAHDAAAGKELWRRELDAGTLPKIMPQNSHASSTPVADDRRVIVYFSSLGLLAFDAADGRDLWRHPLPLPAYLMTWGAATSPILWRDGVYFCQDDDLTPYVICVDAVTGKLRWKTPRPEMLAGYAVPVMCEAGGRTDLVLAGTGKLKGYDPATGKELWTCSTLLRTIMTSPVVKDGVIYVAVQSYGDAARTLKFALMEWLDTNQDGKLARAEMPEEFREKFELSDKNKDGVLTADEIEFAFQHPNNMAGGGNTIQAVKGGGTGDVTKTHVLWNFTKSAPSNLTSPLVSNGRLFVVKAGGLSSCFDTATGKPLWERERVKNFGDYYGSPVAADGKIYVPARNGFVIVLADAPELKILARNDIGGALEACPAIADGRIYIRTREKLFCFAENGR